MEISKLRDNSGGASRFFFENVGEFLFADGHIITQDEFLRKIYDENTWSNKIVYEVIRVIGGKPLFFDDHYQRLLNSVGEGKRAFVPESARLKSELLELVNRHLSSAGGEIYNAGVTDCNVKLWMTFCGSGGARYIMNINKSVYPDEEAYKNGVECTLINLTRSDPNNKIVVNGYKEKVSQIMQDKNVFEALLVDGENTITEGSRTNLFFAVGEKLYTAPSDMILKGIARKYVFEAAKKAGIEIVESRIRADGLDTVDGLFLSGTTVGIVPIKKVDDTFFDSPNNKLILGISVEYNNFVNQNLAAYK